MLDTVRYEMQVCGCQHERYQDKGFDKVIAEIKNCTHRALGENLLCAHTDVFPDDPEPYQRLLEIASKKRRYDLCKIFDDVKDINTILDSLVRSSYSGGAYRSFGNAGICDSISKKLEAIFGELEKILAQSTDIGKDLNNGQRARFQFLVTKIQRAMKQILEDTMEALNC